MFTGAGEKIADAWGGIRAGGLRDAAQSAWGSRAGERRDARVYVGKRIGKVRDHPRKAGYGAAGVVGVSSGAYMWHRHNLNQQQNGGAGPYYY